MVLQHKYFIRKHYVQVPYAVNANMDLILQVFLMISFAKHFLNMKNIIFHFSIFVPSLVFDFSKLII